MCLKPVNKYVMLIQGENKLNNKSCMFGRDKSNLRDTSLNLPDGQIVEVNEVLAVQFPVTGSHLSRV